MSEEVGDGLWVGCATVSKEGRLCEKTIELPPEPGKFPCFTVCDLSQDERFQQLPFVTGPPGFRYYAGTPLTTNRGVNIGSLFILDNKVRPRLNPDQEAFLGTIAQTIMRHLEMSREAEERKKGMQMSRGLNAFVEGKSSLALEGGLAGASSPGSQSHLRHHDVGTSRTGRRRAISSSGGKIPPRGTIPESANKASESSTHRTSRRDAELSGTALQLSGASTPGDQYSSQEEADIGSPREDTDARHRRTFARAANLLRESLNLDHSGGIAFLDTTLRYRGREDEGSGSASASDDTSAAEEIGSGTSNSTFDQRFGRRQSTFTERLFSATSRISAGQVPAEILGFSTPEFNMGTDDTPERIETFSPMGERVLQSFLQRYPRGKLWSFDEGGSLSSSEEEILSPKIRKSSSATKPRSSGKKLAEARALQKHFPGGTKALPSHFFAANIISSATTALCPIMGCRSGPLVFWLFLLVYSESTSLLYRVRAEFHCSFR